MLMKVLKYALVFFLGMFASLGANAQIIKDMTKWSYSVKKTGDNKYDLVFTATIQDGFHLNSLNPGIEGLLPPSFKFDKNPLVTPDGKIKEKGKLIKEVIEDIGTNRYYKHSVQFIQSVKVSGNTKVTGKHKWQICDSTQCLTSKTLSFSFNITDAVAMLSPEDSAKVAAASAGDSSINTGGGSGSASAGSAGNAADDSTRSGAMNADDKSEKKQEQKSLAWLFLFAFLGGLAAVLTPCVYSMIPITVSFFTKRSKTRAEGIRNAIYYSLSIIIIFTVFGIAISAIFGANALNNLSTNWIANLVFFVIFMIFGISFLGAFEITLPSSWTSKTDSRANTKNFAGIFFMALTLVIVSFSCTGPIVGPLLVAAGGGGVTGPAVGMFGFSIGLALPFALFAVFPGMLNKLAASGGWLNQVKVTLGFLELALALKFLSNADLAMGWRLLDREIFIALWIVIFVLQGFYLLGKLKFSHDDADAKNVYGQEYVSIFKLFLAISCFSFSVYLLPGMWGAPLNGMSQFVPPMGTQDFVLGADNGNSSGGHSSSALGDVRPVKYAEEMKIYEPEIVRKFGLITFFEYDEALAASKKLKKPVMLDFTGINCVNCRKMESQVWSSPEVMKRLKEDFIIASLYCDYDKRDLPENEQYYSQILGSDVVTVGDKNEDIQATKFNSNSQPFYFFVDENGNKLVEGGYPYDPNVAKFVEHLDRVKEEFRKRNP